jgi:hypothetical protein
MATGTKKDISFKADQTSSAATHYGGADKSWLSKIKGTVDWIKIPQVDFAKMQADLKELVTKLTGGNLAKEIGVAILGNLKELLGQAKQAVKTQLNSILEVGGKILGKLPQQPKVKAWPFLELFLQRYWWWCTFRCRT